MLRVADVLAAGTPAYLEHFGERILPSHRSVLGAVCACRTSMMGGHLLQCDNPSCGDQVFRYHSCGNRHCPRCHRARTARWTAQWIDRLLPVPYYLLTFTLPRELRSLARSNQKVVYAAMIRASALAIQTLAADSKWVGATLGLLAILHTWTRSMAYHPHVHILVTAGGLAVDDEGKSVWRDPKNPRFLMPGYILSKVFRSEMRRLLAGKGLLEEITLVTWTKKWVVHCQHAGNGTKVLRYLARYLDRIAISDARIVSFVDAADVNDARVTFRWTDRQHETEQRMTLALLDFMARYLQHVLPAHFPKVRAYGLFASATRTQLDTARNLLRDFDSITPADTQPQIVEEPRHDHCCKACNIGRYRFIASFGPMSPLESIAQPEPASRAPP